jgi:flagellar operon protein
MSVSELYRTLGPIGPVDSRPSSPAEALPKKGEISDFEKVLLRQQEPERAIAPAAQQALKFSNHAETRIRSRAIEWNPELEKRVVSGIDSAREKGSREALILAGNVAVIANVRSGTVITAMDASHLKEKIFTNIDSAVLV